MNKIIVLVTLVITLSSIASAIEVGGHLTEDTIWSPGNNPYLVTENLYVDSGVTLTILPGTEIKINAAPCTSWANFSQYFWLPDNEAKMIWVDGIIIAEGTEQDNIKFSKIQDDPDYCWGTIKINEQADISSFKYCKIEYSAGTGIALGDIAIGSISIYNGSGIIKNCYILNNASSIVTRYTDINKLEISNNIIQNNQDFNNFVANMWNFEFSTGSVLGNSKALIVGNYFRDCIISFNSIYFKNNIVNSSPIHIANNNHISILSDNQFLNFQTAIGGGNVNDSIYINKNQFIGGYAGIDINQAYIEVDNNYFEDCNLETYISTGKIINNRFNNGRVFLHNSSHGNIAFINNLIYNYNSSSYAFSSYKNEIKNNIFINNIPNLISDSTDSLFINCIIINNGSFHWWPNPHGNDTFRNCIIDFPLDPPLVDGGGNIIVDSLQALEIFVDIENGDFHLAPNSIAIDAGFDTLGYYYPFDLENSVRVWDGDGDGNAIIDIGAYEYGAPQFGKITGYITETFSGEPVDYVLLKADNEPGEFTFVDSNGYFEIQLPEGTYDLYAERVFYEDNIIYTVTVENEQTTEIAFNMTYEDPLVGVEDNEININCSELTVSNYPNPFNPTTTISFNLSSNSDVSVEVYNVKGQKVKTLLKEKMNQGQHEVVWNGLNEKNKPVSSGVYLYKVKAGNQETVKRMILLK